MVHRLLTAVLENEMDSFYATPEEIHGMLEHCNEKKEASKAAQERGDTVYFCVFLKQRPGVISEAVVMDWGDSSFELFVPEYGVSKRVHVDDLHCQLENKKDGFHLRPSGGSGGGSGGGCDWKCKCGWNNKSRNKVCGGGSSSHGCGGLAPIGGSGSEQKTAGGDASHGNRRKDRNPKTNGSGGGGRSTSSKSGCRMMNDQVMPSHGMRIQMLTRMSVMLYHVNKIPIDFGLEIQSIYNWEQPGGGKSATTTTTTTSKKKKEEK